MKTNIRFFICDVDLDDGTSGHGITEVEEREFLDAEGVIEYERDTVFENGVDQVCLTKNLFKG